MSTYKGNHEARAWVEHTSTDNTFGQDGKVFLTEPERVRELLESPDGGLEDYLRSKGVTVEPGALKIKYDEIVGVVQPILAGGKPKYNVSQDPETGLYVATKTGIIPVK